MVLKPNEVFLFECVVYICVLIAILALFLFGVQMPVWLVVLFAVFYIGCIVMFVFSSGRTVSLDENGCTICFLWIKKTYAWSEMKTKRIERFSLPSMWDRYQYPYPKSAIFAPYKVFKFKLMIRPWHYVWLHPFSFIYINFPQKTVSHVKDCEIDEEEFWLKMKEWGVTID